MVTTRGVFPCDVLKLWPCITEPLVFLTAKSLFLHMKVFLERELSACVFVTEWESYCSPTAWEAARRRSPYTLTWLNWGNEGGWEEHTHECMERKQRQCSLNIQKQRAAASMKTYTTALMRWMYPYLYKLTSAPNIKIHEKNMTQRQEERLAKPRLPLLSSARVSKGVLPHSFNPRMWHSVYYLCISRWTLLAV